MTAFHLVDERLFFRVVGRSDLEDAADCVAEIFGNIGYGFYGFANGAGFLFGVGLHLFRSGCRRLSLTVFIPFECLADYLVRTSAVAVNLRSLELPAILRV